VPHDHRKRALPFIALGAAFFAIGLTNQRAFIAVGAVFWIVGLVLLTRRRREAP
jgi:hypothetical protein